MNYNAIKINSVNSFMRAFIILLILVAQVSCSDEDLDIHAFEDDSRITTLNGTWKVVSFEDFSTMEVQYPTEENSWGEEIVITFDDTKSPNELSGSNTTNQISAEFDYLGERQIVVGIIISTQIAQPEWADKFTEAMGDSDLAFKINSKSLRIYYENNTKSVTFIKV